MYILHFLKLYYPELKQHVTHPKLYQTSYAYVFNMHFINHSKEIVS